MESSNNEVKQLLPMNNKIHMKLSLSSLILNPAGSFGLCTFKIISLKYLCSVEISTAGMEIRTHPLAQGSVKSSWVSTNCDFFGAVLIRHWPIWRVLLKFSSQSCSR